MIRRRAAMAAALVGLAALSAGCSVGYVARAGYEEARLLWRRQPIADVLAGDPSPALREKLLLALQVRVFARDHVGLSVGGSYEALATVDAGQIVHVVSAAPRDQLVAVTWWFPIVGRVPYRAYFDVAEAQALADGLEREGFDTTVRPAVAFSTLGWFDDPLLTSLLRHDDERLAETMLHEILHGTLYVPGHAAFNESFATFVGLRGCEAFFLAGGQPRRAARCADRWADALTFSAFLRRVVDRLERAYARGIGATERAELFADAHLEFARQPWRTAEYGGFVDARLNNAVLLHERLYADRLHVFDAVYVRFGGDLRATIAWIRSAVAGRRDPYATLEAALAQGSIAASAAMPRRTETRKTSAIRTRTAANDATTPTWVAIPSGACVNRLEKTT